ncbi:MAG: histidine phosphatase family protein [Intrasporangiaceae bacterium]|nr:histidine phosphatase family protein [Intrasporangiaceae bacterium]
MAVTLVVVRHAKSDWSTPITDRDRPLAKRGRKQAPSSGRWVAQNVGELDLAVVSVAARAQQTWERVSRELGYAVPTRVSEPAYTFDGRKLLAIVAELPSDATTVALVGHNPAVEELIEMLTGEWVPMPTSALAVVELADWAVAGAEKGRLVAAGRPADDRWYAGAVGKRV